MNRLVAVSAALVTNPKVSHGLQANRYIPEQFRIEFALPNCAKPGERFCSVCAHVMILQGVLRAKYLVCDPLLS